MSGKRRRNKARIPDSLDDDKEGSPDEGELDADELDNADEGEEPQQSGSSSGGPAGSG